MHWNFSYCSSVQNWSRRTHRSCCFLRKNGSVQGNEVSGIFNFISSTLERLTSIQSQWQCSDCIRRRSRRFPLASECDRTSSAPLEALRSRHRTKSSSWISHQPSLRKVKGNKRNLEKKNNISDAARWTQSGTLSSWLVLKRKRKTTKRQALHSSVSSLKRWVDSVQHLET